MSAGADLPLFSWAQPQGSAVVVPFPSTRRIAYVKRNARQAAKYRRPEAAENYIRGQADAARGRLLKVGVAAEAAEADARALEVLLWIEYDRLVARKDGVA